MQRDGWIQPCDLCRKRLRELLTIFLDVVRMVQSPWFVLTTKKDTVGMFPANCAPHKIVAVPTTAPSPKWLWITHSGSLSARTFTHPRASSAGQPIFPATTKPLARAARSFLCPAKNEEEEEQRKKGQAWKLLELEENFVDSHICFDASPIRTGTSQLADSQIPY